MAQGGWGVVGHIILYFHSYNRSFPSCTCISLSAYRHGTLYDKENWGSSLLFTLKTLLDLPNNLRHKFVILTDKDAFRNIQEIPIKSCYTDNFSINIYEIVGN